MKIKRRFKTVFTYATIAAYGVLMFSNGRKRGYAEGYKRGYLMGGADMYDSHIYPDEGITFDPTKDME